MYYALSSEMRLSILVALEDGAMSAAALRKKLRITPVSLASHLDVLVKRGFVIAQMRRDDKEKSYALNTKGVGDAMALLRQLHADKKPDTSS